VTLQTTCPIMCSTSRHIFLTLGSIKQSNIPPVTVSDVMGARAVWRKRSKKNTFTYCVDITGFYFEPRAGGEIRIFGLCNNKKKEESKKNRLALCTLGVCFPTNMMTICLHFSRIWYVSPYGLGLVLLCWQAAVFSNYQIVHGLPLPPFFHPDPLECLCLRRETALSVSA